MRGFPADEFAGRLTRAQKAMGEADLDALLLTNAADFYWFTGYLTRFWESPTRPWFLLVPQSGAITAVIPEIGAALMAKTGLEDIRTWPSPQPADDGVSLLAATLDERLGSGKVGVPDGPETMLRMPLADFARLRDATSATITSDQSVMTGLRLIKSAAEIAKIEHACTIAGRAFDRLSEIARPGEPLDRVFARFQMLCLEEGADHVSYLAGGAGRYGYDDVISPASTAPLQTGDVLMLDTGVVWDGYFCDYDRNVSLGPPAAEVVDTHRRLIDATQAGFEAAGPGITAADLWQVIDTALGGNSSGRLGHGLGLALTEWPTFLPHDQTVLAPGMVLTLEPSAPTRDGCMLVHEENIVITETGARALTDFAPREIRQI